MAKATYAKNFRSFRAFRGQICGQYKHEHRRHRINGLAICFRLLKKQDKTNKNI